MKPNVNQTLGFSHTNKSICINHPQLFGTAYLDIRNDVCFGFKKNKYFLLHAFYIKKIIAV